LRGIGAACHEHDIDDFSRRIQKHLVLVELALPVRLHPFSHIDDSPTERNRGQAECPRFFF